MENKNVFDVVMDYIDEHITSSSREIAKGIYAETGYTEADISKFIVIISKGIFSLKGYIAQRKAFFAARELAYMTEKPLIEIAVDYYADQPALNRAMKKYYNLTPAEIRKKMFVASDNKLQYSDFYAKHKSRLDSILEEFFKTHDVANTNDFRYFEEFIRATEEYGFDETTCSAISTISDKAGVPFSYMLNACFDIIIDYKSNPDYLDPMIETVINFGLKSEKEMKDICDYFDCEYYQLTQFMIMEYRRRKKELEQRGN